MGEVQSESPIKEFAGWRERELPTPVRSSIHPVNSLLERRGPVSPMMAERRWTYDLRFRGRWDQVRGVSDDICD